MHLKNVVKDNENKKMIDRYCFFSKNHTNMPNDSSDVIDYMKEKASESLDNNTP